MRVVIADDEELVRFSVRDMLSDLSCPVTVVGEAKNGRELVEICRTLKPDLALVDIRMPGMSGLDAIDMIRKASPDTDWLILTSYPEFEYARRAVSVGAVEYLLKPVGPEELNVALNRAAERRSKRLATANQGFENRINGIMSRVILDIDESAGSWAYSVAFTVVDTNRAGDLGEGVYGEAGKLLRDDVAELAGTATRVAVVKLRINELLGVFAWNAAELEFGTPESLKDRFENRMGKTARRFSTSGRALSVVLFGPIASLAELTARVDRLRSLAMLRPLLGFGRSVDASRLDALSTTKATRDLAGALAAAAGAWRDRRPLAFEQAIRDAGHLFRERPELQKRDIEVTARRYLAILVSPEVGPFADLGSWMPPLLDSLKRNRSPETSESGGKAVEQVVQYVDENYMKDASIMRIAEVLDLTPNYLSALFHKRVGTTFTRYLTRVRMEKARELLLQSNQSVAEVASAVGYASTRHFARTFKRIFEVYPSRLRHASDR